MDQFYFGKRRTSGKLGRLLTSWRMSVSVSSNCREFFTFCCRMSAQSLRVHHNSGPAYYEMFIVQWPSFFVRSLGRVIHFRLEKAKKLLKTETTKIRRQTLYTGNLMVLKMPRERGKPLRPIPASQIRAITPMVPQASALRGCDWGIMRTTPRAARRPGTAPATE